MDIDSASNILACSILLGAAITVLIAFVLILYKNYSFALKKITSSNLTISIAKKNENHQL